MNRYYQKRILLVEDDPICAGDQKYAVEKYGYQMSVVSSGEAALSLFLCGKDFDLVLMDIDLGEGMDGTEAAQKILELKDVPLIFLSSHTEPEVVAKTEGITSYGYIVKNSGDTVLDASIKMAFRLFEARQREKQKSEALVESEARTRITFDAITDTVFLLPFVEDVYVNFIDINQTACERYGYSREEFLKLRLSDVIAEDEISKHHSPGHLHELIASKSIIFETVHVTKSGDPFPAEIHSTLFSLNGRQVILAVVRDISERKKIEASLMIGNGRERDFLDMIDQSIWIISTEGRLIDCNQKAAEHTGYSRNELLERGLGVIDVFLSEEDIRRSVENVITDGFHVFETKHRHKDGKIFSLKIFSNLIDYRGKRVIFSIARSISDRQKEAVYSREERDLFMQAVNHKAKNNIAKLDSVLYLQMQQVEDKKIRDVLAGVRSQLSCMGSLYESLLAQGLAEKNSIKNYVSRLLVHLAGFIFDDNVEIVESVDENLLFDEGRLFILGIIIEELLTNMSKYSFSGEQKRSIEIRIQADNDAVRILVSDNGVNVCKQKSFKSTDGVVHGMYLVTLLTEQLGGTFGCIGEEHTCFEICLPHSELDND